MVVPLDSEILGHDRHEEVQKRNQEHHPHVSDGDLQVILEEMIVVTCKSRLRVMGNTPVYIHVRLVVQVDVAGVGGKVALVEILHQVRLLGGQQHDQVCAVQVESKDEDVDDEALQSDLEGNCPEVVLLVRTGEDLRSERVEGGGEAPQDTPQKDVVHGVSESNPCQHGWTKVTREYQGDEGQSYLDESE